MKLLPILNFVFLLLLASGSAACRCHFAGVDDKDVPCGATITEQCCQLSDGKFKGRNGNNYAADFDCPAHSISTKMAAFSFCCNEWHNDKTNKNMYSDCKCASGCNNADAAANETSPVDTLTTGLSNVNGDFYCSIDPSIHKL